MRPLGSSVLVVTLFLLQFAASITFDCSHIQVDRKKFDLSKLGDHHSVTTQDTDHPPAIRNTTWTLDICNALGKLRDLPSNEQCPGGTYVCGVQRTWNPDDDPNQEKVVIEKVIPVAGSMIDTGTTLDPLITRLKKTDSSREGLQIELNGGSYGIGDQKKKQKAIIEFQCDKDRTGNEGNENPERRLRRRDGDSKEDGDSNAGNSSLTFVSYGEVTGAQNMDVLRLDWRTKYACEDYEQDDDDEEGQKKASWGFFTWFILILFLGTAAYLIFGSWLNYNRYGARGWDLLPHGDTIRDIPYIFKDWSRKVVDTVSGGGTRGGYSAV